MKIKQGVIGAVALLFATVVQSFAIEGLKLSLQCSNVVLSWPSVEGDTYVIRRRPDLTTNSTWTCLTNSFPAESGTNLSIFIDYGMVRNANCGGSGGSSAPALRAGGGGTNRMLSVRSAGMAGSSRSGVVRPLPPLPPGLAYAADGSVETVPWPAARTRGLAMTTTSAGGVSGFGSPSPNGAGGSGGNSTNAATDAEFYEVVKVGVHLFGITNGMILSGQVPLNIEFGNTDPNGTLIALYLTDTDPDGTNGTISGTSFPYFPDQATNYLRGLWDTTQVTNGSYTIQLGATLDDGTFYSDHPVTVTVSNLAWLIDPWNINGRAIFIGVQTPYTDGAGAWRVDAYDDQNNHVGYFPGIIDANGYLSYPGNPGIGFSINNADQNGNLNPSTYYTLVYSADAAHPLSATPPYIFTNKTLIEFPWDFSPTLSTICYMDVFGDGKPEAQKQASDMMQIVASIESIYHPLENAVGDPGNVYQVRESANWTNVIDNGIHNPSSRDFVYFGHGNPTAIGVTGTQLTSKQVADSLQNKDTNGDPTNAPNHHAYRFVFLDGCKTAEGDWPQAFGIPKKTGMKITDFANKRGLRPRAFMGWNKEKAIGLVGSGLMNPDHISYITTFWSAWKSTDANGQLLTLQESIRRAGIITDQNGNQFPNPERNGMVLYGAQDLTIAQ